MEIDIMTMITQAPSTALALLVWYEVKHIRQSITDLAVSLAKLETRHGEETKKKT